jgi:hypothetical protein
MNATPILNFICRGINIGQLFMMLEVYLIVINIIGPADGVQCESASSPVQRELPIF